MTASRLRKGGLGEVVAVGAALSLVAFSLVLATYLMSRDADASEVGVTQGVEAVAPEEVSPLLDDPDAFMVARRSGAILVGLAAREGGPIDVLVFGAEELPLLEGTVNVSVDGGPARTLPPGTCGAGCFRVEAVPFSGSSVQLRVQVERSGKPPERVRFRLPAALPPSGATLLERAKRTMLALRTVRVEETLTAGARPVRSSWEIEAPDRLSVTASDGGSTVLIGKRRWDLIDGTWRKSTWDGARQPCYAWEKAGNARILGTARIEGEQVSRLAAFTPDPEPWWFTLAVADDGRVLEVDMLAPSHFMVDRFFGFDGPVEIEPPAG